MTRKELVTRLAREIRIGARVIEIKEAALAAAAARELRKNSETAPCVLVPADKKVAEPRDAVLVQPAGRGAGGVRRRAGEANGEPNACYSGSSRQSSVREEGVEEHLGEEIMMYRTWMG